MVQESKNGAVFEEKESTRESSNRAEVQEEKRRVSVNVSIDDKRRKTEETDADETRGNRKDGRLRVPRTVPAPRFSDCEGGAVHVRSTWRTNRGLRIKKERWELESDESETRRSSSSASTSTPSDPYRNGVATFTPLPKQEDKATATGESHDIGIQVPVERERKDTGEESEITIDCLGSWAGGIVKGEQEGREEKNNRDGTDDKGALHSFLSHASSITLNHMLWSQENGIHRALSQLQKNEFREGSGTIRCILRLTKTAPSSSFTPLPSSSSAEAALARLQCTDLSWNATGTVLAAAMGRTDVVGWYVALLKGEIKEQFFAPNRENLCCFNTY